MKKTIQIIAGTTAVLAGTIMTNSVMANADTTPTPGDTTTNQGSQDALNAEVEANPEVQAASGAASDASTAVDKAQGVVDKDTSGVTDAQSAANTNSTAVSNAQTSLADATKNQSSAAVAKGDAQSALDKANETAKTPAMPVTRRPVLVQRPRVPLMLLFHQPPMLQSLPPLPNHQRMFFQRPLPMPHRLISTI